LTLLALLSLLLPTLTLADELLRQRLSELQAQDRPSLAGVRLASAKLLAAAYGERGFAYAWGRAGQVTDLLALVEDEVLLALPLVPRHENCDPPVKAGVDEEISPFAVLRQLRGKV